MAEQLKLPSVDPDEEAAIADALNHWVSEYARKKLVGPCPSWIDRKWYDRLVFNIEVSLRAAFNKGRVVEERRRVGEMAPEDYAGLFK